MKRLLLLPALLLLASFTAGCVEEPEPGANNFEPVPWCTSDDFQRPELEVVDLDGTAPTPSAGPAFAGVLDGEVEDSTACDCTDESCVVDWIEENMGCGICVHMACGDGPTGGCVPCPDPTPSEPSRDSADLSPCVIAPVEINEPGWDIQVQPSSSDVEASTLPVLTLDATLVQNR